MKSQVRLVAFVTFLSVCIAFVSWLICYSPFETSLGFDYLGLLMFLPGIIYPFFIAGIFDIGKNIPDKRFWFIVLSAVGYSTAIALSEGTLSLTNHDILLLTQIDQSYLEYFLGGAVGALIFLLGLRICMKVRISTMIVLALAGGILASTGVFFDPSTPILRPSLQVFLLWQVGMTLGILFFIVKLPTIKSRKNK